MSMLNPLAALRADVDAKREALRLAKQRYADAKAALAASPPRLTLNPKGFRAFSNVQGQPPEPKDAA